MIEGRVNEKLEATLNLQVFGPNGQTGTITVVIDTGYNGSLSLPASIVARLVLPQAASRAVILADTTRRLLNYYSAALEWDGQRREIPVLCVEGDPLLGTALLKNYKLDAAFVVNGKVHIQQIANEIR